MGSKKQQKKNKTTKKKEEVDDEGGRQDAAAVSPFRNGGKVITDPRFASVHSDPRFQNVPTHRSKVVIDSRFDKMFSDKSFATSSAPSDKRGKPKPRHKTAKEKSDSNPLRQYYRIEEDEEKEEEEKSKGNDDDNDDDAEDDNEEVDEVRVKDPKTTLKKLGDESSESSESEDSGEEEDDDDDVESADSEDSSDTGSEEEEDDVYMEDEEDEDALGVENVPVIEEETHRLAIVNMDWRHVRAVDLYVVLSSFLPKGGQILSVSVYPSDFGLERMEQEAVHGPIGLFDGDKGQDDEDNDDEIDEEKLRAYEQSKLRYYYAVVDCDSSATADHLYKGCDGVEFERSSNKLDLRFIPDSMEFKHPPRDVATEAPSTYEGLDFYTRELQQSKVNLTWDEDEPHRAKTLKRKFNADQLAELEFKEFLVSDDSENEEDENDEAIEVQSNKKHKKRDMYRALLLSGDGSDDNDDDGGQDMEVTFNTGLEDLSKRILEKKDKKSETVWDAYLRKKSEKKKARKSRTKHSSDDESSDTDEKAMEQPDDFFIEEPSARRGNETHGKSNRKEKQHQEMDKEAEASRAELELLLADDTGTNANVKGYNLKPKRDKGRKKKQVLDEEKLPTTDYDDPRFSALFKSHHFALDPTDPQFKRSAAYARQLAQKQHKGDIEEIGHNKLPTDSQLPSDDYEMNKNEKVKFEVMNSNKEKHELSSMLKSIKMKSKQVQRPSGGKYMKR